MLHVHFAISLLWHVCVGSNVMLMCWQVTFLYANDKAVTFYSKLQHEYLVGDNFQLSKYCNSGFIIWLSDVRSTVYLLVLSYQLLLLKIVCKIPKLRTENSERVKIMPICSIPIVKIASRGIRKSPKRYISVAVKPQVPSMWRTHWILNHYR